MKDPQWCSKLHFSTWRTFLQSWQTSLFSFFCICNKQASHLMTVFFPFFPFVLIIFLISCLYNSIFCSTSIFSFLHFWTASVQESNLECKPYNYFFRSLSSSSLPQLHLSSFYIINLRISLILQSFASI